MTRQQAAINAAISTHPNRLELRRSMQLTTTLREEIGRGLDDMAVATRLVKLIASRGVTPWTVRLIKEAAIDLDIAS